jgi:arabinofuranosyltransferase
MENSPRGGSLPAFLPAAAALALAAVYFLAERHTLGEFGFPLDDSYIHLQFARQLAAGDGLSFNPGVLVTGSSSPLWTALLSLGFLFPGLALAWPKLLGVAALLATVFGSGRLLARLGAAPFYQIGGALLVATLPWLSWSALSGMEVLLFAALIVWTLALAIEDEERRPEAPGLAPYFLASLAVLARPEGLLLLGLLFLSRLFRLRRGENGRPRLAPGAPAGLAKAALLAAAMVLPLLAFNLAVGGSPWPTTLAAKTVADDSLLPNARYLATALKVLWEGGGLLLPLAGCGFLLLVVRSAYGKTSLLLPGLFCFGLPVAYSLLASDNAPPPVGNFGRYLFPLLPLLAAMALVGLERAFKPLRSGKLRRALPVVTLAALLIVQGVQAMRGIKRYAQNVKDVHGSDVAAARFLAKVLPAEAVIATQDIGAIKLLLPNRIIDLTGIATPEVVPLLREKSTVYWEQRLYDFLAAEKPDLVVVFSKNYPGLARGRVGNLAPVASFTLDNNITMAGDELMILRTPWCRFPLAAKN